MLLQAYIINVRANNISEDAYLANKWKGLLLNFSCARFVVRFEGKFARAWTRREYSEQLSHWNIEGRRKFGCKSQRGALDGGPAEGCAARERGTTHRIAPQCTASASALQPCSIRCRVRARVQRAYIRNHANVMRVRCSCGPWRLVPCRWRLLQPRPVRAHPASILDRHRPP